MSKHRLFRNLQIPVAYKKMASHWRHIAQRTGCIRSRRAVSSITSQAEGAVRVVGKPAAEI